jgi:hypothetical protein
MLKTRSAALVLTMLLLASCQSAPQSGPQSDPRSLEPGEGRGAYVVYTELGKSQVAMKPGSNVRVFNSVHGDGGTFIVYDPATGILTLAPGTYRINGYSIKTFGYLLTKEQQSAVRSVPGYAYLWSVDDNSVAVLGSMQDAMFSQASHVNDIVTVSKPTSFYLGHQNGVNVAGVLLQAYDAAVTTSTDHVFARLVVERL